MRRRSHALLIWYCEIGNVVVRNRDEGVEVCSIESRSGHVVFILPTRIAPSHSLASVAGVADVATVPND